MILELLIQNLCTCLCVDFFSSILEVVGGDVLCTHDCVAHPVCFQFGGLPLCRLLFSASTEIQSSHQTLKGVLPARTSFCFLLFYIDMHVNDQYVNSVCMKVC